MSLPPLLLVRHGRAGSRSRWNGDDRMRPLDAKGRRQAQALVAELSVYPVQLVLSSPFLRCVQTVEPLAASLGVEVERDERLGEGAGPREALELLRELAGRCAALCTHGDVLEEVVGQRAKKGGSWVLDGSTLRPVAYLPPPA